MEVHHHTKTPLQKWKHYAWEFFMLFLAITLGFYVENRREHYIEHKHEKRYMQMITDDLRADLQEIDRVETSRIAREKMLDTLLTILPESKNPAKVAAIYRLSVATDSYESFLRNDRTIGELKSAGGMRYIRNKNVSAGIMEYDNFISAEVDWNNKTEASRIDYYKQIRFQLLDAQLMNDIVKGNNSTASTLLPAAPVVINSIAGALFQVKRISETCRESGTIAKEKIKKLIDLIQQEYRVK